MTVERVARLMREGEHGRIVRHLRRGGRRPSDDRPAACSAPEARWKASRSSTGSGSSRHLDDIAVRLWQHIGLTVIPVAVGMVIAVLLAIWSVRRPRVYGPITAINGILYTIPSIAAFAIVRPIFGLSLLTAIIPLTTYTLLILVRNNVAGLQAVPPDVLEAADGHGLHPTASACARSSCRWPSR